VLERLTPLDAGESIEEPAEQTTEPESVRARGASKRAAGQGARKVATSGHTIYLPDALFERIMVQAHRKKKTISDYVAAILERQVPDYRTSRTEPGDSDAA
jgi:hypothetical protein